MQPTSVSPKASVPRCWYKASIDEFLASDIKLIVGELVTNCDFTVLQNQKDTWLAQINILKPALAGLTGHVLLEFSIPRMGRRIDVVLLINAAVLVLEFKVGYDSFDASGRDQVWDYALDLKNFHEASHARSIVPILIATDAPATGSMELQSDADHVYRPIVINKEQIRKAIDLAIQCISGPRLDVGSWSCAPYHPTPTIIEAARSLYAQHSVDAIARYDAGAKNLRVTSSRIEELVVNARSSKSKIICFVTGVPGAGKTLVGLNVATHKRDAKEPTHAVFLSGNGPLVAVLREALTRDEFDRRKARGEKVRKGKVGESIKTFIQNVHHFRDDALRQTTPPIEHVVIFDEAQRAWNQRQTASFMKRKKNRPGFEHSEPEFLISFMDRHEDWAVIVCLVGGGQEINVGEAGIGAWLDAVNKSFPHWKMYISSNLTDTEYAAGKAIESVKQNSNVAFDDSLHLSVSMRSFRAENVSAFVKSLLDCDKAGAREIFKRFEDRYPIAVTRDLNRAKQWVRSHARGSERFGLVASSKAQRLKPHAIDIRVDVDPVHWFLNGKGDTRSSYYLEDTATEFQVQGLELDWTCVNWDGDLRFDGNGWSFHDFRGDRWCNVSNPDNQNYLRNAYRVLLTRARQGMVIFVPQGDINDPTRSSEYYDPIFAYLTDLGIPAIES